jgi:hypothetical protein
MAGYGSNSSNPNYTESVASLTRKTKEDIRLDQLIPSEILQNSGTTGIKQLLENYYKFMNMDEFLYSENEIHTDAILSNKAVYRISDPKNENNTFFTDETGADSTLVIALDTINPSTGNKLDTIPLSSTNVSITNGNELPGSLKNSTSEIGKTLTVSGLSNVLYRSATLSPAVTLTDSEVSTSGTITGLTGEFGFGYPQDGDVDFSALPTIAISAPGSGTTATATATLYSALDNNKYWGGVVVTITNAGSGYTIANPPTVTITANSRAGTTAIIRNQKTATLTTPIQYWVGPGPSYILNSIEEAMNIDETTDDYLELIQKEIAAAIPRKLTVDKRSLYKNITDFYKLKGSQDSVEVFFRLLFNESVEVEYPWDKTLIPSEGAWDAGLNRYLDHKGFLSDNIKIQDSLFYQKFSYLIRTGRNLSDWSAAFERLVHPAGFVFFGEILLLTQLTRAALGDNDRISSYTVGTGANATTNDGDGNIQVEGLLDTNGNPLTGIMYRFKDVYGRTNRKTLSSMPGLQPGVIGLEDLMVLVEAFASTFLPNFVTRINKSATLSTNIGSGVIQGITILEKGWGYTTAPTTANGGITVQTSSGTGAVVSTTLDENGSIDTVTVSGSMSGYTSAYMLVSAAPNVGKVQNIYLSNKADKTYTTAPVLAIGAPTSVDADGNLLSTNVTATATVNLDAEGEVTGITLNNAGNGYVKDPIVRVNSPTSSEGRAKDVKEIAIIMLNHIANVDAGPYSTGFKTIELNDYFGRKENSYYESKKFRDNYPISFFSDKIIKNTYKTSINSYNVKTIINQE